MNHYLSLSLSIYLSVSLSTPVLLFHKNFQTRAARNHLNLHAAEYKKCRRKRQKFITGIRDSFLVIRCQKMLIERLAKERPSLGSRSGEREKERDRERERERYFEGL